MGKGCRYRPVNRKLWDESYDRIYGEKHARNRSEADKQESKNVVAGGSVHEKTESPENKETT